MKSISFIGKSVFIIWLVGALLMALAYEFERRADCITNGGLLKGFFFCETNPSSRYEVGTNHLGRIIKGLSWPYDLVDLLLNNKNPISDSTTILDNNSNFETRSRDRKSNIITGKYDVRRFKWGATKEEVISIEGEPNGILFSDDSSLRYRAKIGEDYLPVSTVFIFNPITDSLDELNYYDIQRFTSRKKGKQSSLEYFYDFKQLQKLLIEKYGIEHFQQFLNYHNSLGKFLPNFIAIKLGWLTIGNIWTEKRTVIAQTIKRDSLVEKIVHNIDYYDIRVFDKKMEEIQRWHDTLNEINDGGKNKKLKSDL